MTPIPQTPTSRANAKSMQAQIERRKRIDAAKARCSDWNRAYPVGTKVRVTLISGRVLDTETRAMASVCTSGYAFVYLKLLAYPVPVEDCEVVK